MPGAGPGNGSPTIGEGYLVLGGNGKDTGLIAYKLDADPTKEPKKAWALDVKHGTQGNCTSIIYKGHTYTKMTSDIPGGDIMFVCVELASGKMVAKIPSHTDSCGSIVAGDGIMIYDGFAASVDPANFRLVPGAEKVIRNEMVFANSHTACYVEGRLYVKARTMIRCLDLRK